MLLGVGVPSRIFTHKHTHTHAPTRERNALQEAIFNLYFERVQESAIRDSVCLGWWRWVHIGMMWMPPESSQKTF